MQKTQTKQPRKISALNRFKKEILSKISDQALVQSDYNDLIPIDKIRLLNRVYPLMWDSLILQPLYQKYNCSNDYEAQNQLKKKKDIQNDYHQMIDELIGQMNSGELDDQQHFLEDLTAMMIESIQMAARSFDEADDNTIIDE